jgi:hypothetical protein
MHVWLEQARSCRASRVSSALRAIQTCAASSSVMQVVLRDTTCFGLGVPDKDEPHDAWCG